jgi:cytochrome P450
MLGLLFAVSTATAVFLYFIIYPIIEYYRDPKGISSLPPALPSIPLPLHPPLTLPGLRRFPPLTPLSGLSNIPFILLAHTGSRTPYVSSLHKAHPIIRIGPNTLSFGHPSAIKDIYGHNTKLCKDGQYEVTAGTHYNLADVLSKPEHARKRKVLSSAYALKNLETWEHKVSDKTARLIKAFDERCTAPLQKGTTTPDPRDLNVDYRAWTNFFTLDAIADIGLSERLGFLDQGNDRVVGERMDGSTFECNYRECLYETAHQQALLVWSYDWYPVLKKLCNIFPYYRRMTALSINWDGIVLHRANKRLKRYRDGEKLDDFFQALMEDKNGEPNLLEWGEIVAEVSIMMNAGSATTAIAMANVLLQLLKNPRILGRVREEIDSVLDEDEVVAPYDKVKHLPYLRACLDESLRLFPPTPHGLGREVPPEGAVIMDEFIPGGTSVSMAAWIAHRDERVFPQADQFIPERWLGEKGRELQPYFLAFSAGARGCIGRNISYLEQAVLLASVLHRYEFALPWEGWDVERLETMNHLVGVMPVKVWRREMGRETGEVAG